MSGAIPEAPTEVLETAVGPVELVTSGTPGARRPGLVGGKGLGLARLEALGYRVPPWFAVTPEGFAGHASASGLDAEIRRWIAGSEDGAGAEAAARRIARRLADEPLRRELARAVVELRRDRFPGGLLAVRSSAVEEDGASSSFAGVHDTLVAVSDDDLLRAIRAVWASTFGERALRYRRARGLPLPRGAVAVIVQQWVEPRTSAVLFTADPGTGDVERIKISSLWGAGEALVGGAEAADGFLVDKRSREVTSRPGAQETKLVGDEENGRLRAVPLPADQREAPSLGDSEVEELRRIALAVERAFGCPQDLELAVDPDGTIWFLQTRPITTVEELGPAAGRRQEWESASVEETWGGITTPMTLSFVRRMSAFVGRGFATVMGIDPEVVRRHRRSFEEGLGFIAGRVYSNRAARYRRLRSIPGVAFAPRRLLPLLGVAPDPELEADYPRITGLRRWGLELPALLGTVLRVLRAFRRNDEIVARFLELFRREHERAASLDFRALAPHELIELFRSVEERLLRCWHAPISNGFYVSVHYRILGKLCADWCGDRSGSLRGRLVTGEGGVDSTEPVRHLLGLAATARRDARLTDLLLREDPGELARKVPADPRFREFAAALRDYVERYHFRCRREMLLEEPSLRRAPELVYQMVANYLRLDDVGSLDPDAREARERRIRRDAEIEAEKRLKRSVGPVRRRVFRRVLARARRGMRHRENIRFARVRMFGLARELVWALGKGLEDRGVLPRADDVFYLTLDEVEAYVEGTAVTADLAGQAALRREEYRRYAEAEPPAERFVTYGMVYHRNRFRPRGRAEELAADGLRGTGCSSGRVEGAVRRLTDSSRDLGLEGGEILVVDRAAPGLVPLYPSLAGLVIERGDTLSHSVIVARELGIPTVVGVPGVTRRLEDGVRVRIDGATGEVAPLGRGAEQEASP